VGVGDYPMTLRTVSASSRECGFAEALAGGYPLNPPKSVLQLGLQICRFASYVVSA